MDFAQAGLLDGLDGDDRDARLHLLRELEQDGFTLAELTAAVNEDRLALLPVERLLGGRYNAKEVSERTGVPAELVLRMRRLIGMPDASAEDRVFGDADLEATKSTSMFLAAGIGESALTEIARVLGESMSRLSATVAAEFAAAFLRPGDSEEDVAQRFSALAGELTPALSPVFDAAFYAHLRENIRRGMIGSAERSSGAIAGAQELTVCFADLVGFTRLGGELEVQELGTVAGRLAEIAADVAVGPVRLVKTIGDAAMLVSPEPEPLVAAALALVAAVDSADLPSVRAGIASGPAVQRSGDYFGHSVNVASRVTGVARPDSVLCTEAIKEATADKFAWSFAGRFRLKGVPEPTPLHRPRPLPAAGSDDDDDRESRAEGAKRRREDRRRR